MNAATMPTPEWADDTLTDRRGDEVNFLRQVGHDLIDVKVSAWAFDEPDGSISHERTIVFNPDDLGDGFTVELTSAQAVELAAVLVKAAAVLAPLEEAHS